MGMLTQPLHDLRRLFDTALYPLYAVSRRLTLVYMMGMDRIWFHLIPGPHPQLPACDASGGEGQQGCGEVRSCHQGGRRAASGGGRRCGQGPQAAKDGDHHLHPAQWRGIPRLPHAWRHRKWVQPACKLSDALSACALVSTTGCHLLYGAVALLGCS